MLKASGASDLSQRSARLAFEVSSRGGTKNPVGALISQLEDQEKKLTFDEKIVGSYGGGYGGGGNVTKQVRTEDPDRLRAAGEIKTLIDALNRNTEATKEQANAGKALARSAERPRLNTAPPARRPSEALAQ